MKFDINHHAQQKKIPALIVLENVINSASLNVLLLPPENIVTIISPVKLLTTKLITRD